MPDISIIVPVYKVEPYLRCCIESILAQTFTDFELILVDDGSPDNCGVICDEYAARDERIIVIHQKNSGVSVARNAGIDWAFANSNSQWITFVDSDDYIVPTYLEHLHRHAMENDADIVTTGAYNFSEDLELANAPQQVLSDKYMSGKECCVNFYREEYREEYVILAGPWGKLCKKFLFTKLRFPAGITIGEDEALVLRLLYLSTKVVVLRAWLYCYRQRMDSAFNSNFTSRRSDYIDAMDSCVCFFEEHNEQEIVQMARKRKENEIAKYVICAHKVGMADLIPQKYQMPILKAYSFIIAETFFHGGIKAVVERARHFFQWFERQKQ